MVIDQSKLPKAERPVAILLIKEQNDQANWELEKYSLNILHKLADLRLCPVHLGNSSSKISKQMHIANKINAVAALIIGTNELTEKQVVLKWLDKQTETRINFENFSLEFTEQYNLHKN